MELDKHCLGEILNPAIRSAGELVKAMSFLEEFFALYLKNKHI